jgi:hypothetical protein
MGFAKPVKPYKTRKAQIVKRDKNVPPIVIGGVF